jgi:restriction system protein
MTTAGLADAAASGVTKCLDQKGSSCAGAQPCQNLSGGATAAVILDWVLGYPRQWREVGVTSPRYYIDVAHAGLAKFQRFEGTDEFAVDQRAAAKRAQWDEQWKRQQSAAARRHAQEQSRARRAQDKEAQRAYVEARKLEAEEATSAAEQALLDIECLLAHTLGVDDRVDFDLLKDRTAFSEPPPVRVRSVAPPAQPEALCFAFVPPRRSIWTVLLEFFVPSTKRERLARQAELMRAGQARVDGDNAERLKRWQAQCLEAQEERGRVEKTRQERTADWGMRKAVYESRQLAANASVDRFRQRYLNRDPDAIEQYCDLVLSSSKYPDTFPQSFAMQYRSESRLLVVEYVLPLPEHLPHTKSAKYVQSRDEILEAELPEAAQRKLYDSAIYQVVIRSLHELFEADVVDAIALVAFNGMVEAIDPATGKPVRPCIVSVQAAKAEFAQLNLGAVEPKACFRKLKGVGSAQLHALAAVPPVVRFTKGDVRFVDGRAVLDGVKDGQNIACMDWSDFEHLVRDLFEREFASGEAEVKVTRSSRDGGVDAVIFDPDPIRGGKLIVQAKRYTNTVGVAAVRDLYGAMTAERASKGILVTTATFGSDSYEFAKDKPITLLDGANLLHLLQKHGVPARIDPREAKRVLSS